MTNGTPYLDVEDLPAYRSSDGAYYYFAHGGQRKPLDTKRLHEHGMFITRSQWESLLAHVGAKVPIDVASAEADAAE